MDSYHFHFERMSNLDLHPLSLPVSRLSPAKSSGSIDQYTNHHSKGDSAYSSFSGGSTVPDYPSPFLLDDLQSNTLHYADLKYAKAKYSPTFLDSDSKSMDHIYRSMAAIAQQSSTVPTNPLPPPPPPARLDSFVTTKNLENSRARQSPEGQLADVSTSQQSRNVELCGVQTEPVYGCGFSQHFQRDQPNQGLVDKTVEPQKPNRLPLQVCQPEHVQQSRSGHSETHRKRSYSAYGRPSVEEQCYVSSCHMPQKSTSGSIHHKGQFYFVTGVFNSPEPSVTQGDSASIADSSEWSYTVQRRRQSCPDGPSGRLFYQEELKFSNHNDIVEPNSKVINQTSKSELTSQGVEEVIMSKEIERHHSSSHPIFYCGPEESLVGNMMTPALIKEDPKTNEPMTSILRQPQVDVPNDKISKETTPLLYHLTGANRASFTNKLKNKNDCGMGSKIPDCDKDKQKAGRDGQVSPSSEHQQNAKSNEQPADFPYLCGTLDDSYKKYYKEKLKDAQSKVLRETSFKRRDLQLSWPHRIKQQPDKKLSVVPTGPLSQKMQPSLDKFTHQLNKHQLTEKENVKHEPDLSQEIVKIIEKEKPQNIAQPQVPRVGCRKRLTADQKKLSHSEPEKLHQLADEPAHITCRSLGNEGEGLLSEGDHGLVAARKKMFETRGRAMSASNFSKSSLKNLQQKALAAYMERKTGQKVTEPQQHVQPVPSHRNSTAGRLSDSGSRYNSSIAGSNKLHRPLSAGRILDSVSSSVKYAQFVNAQPRSQSRQSSWREDSTKAGKSSSAENLLDQPEQPEFFRARSTSTPYRLQVPKYSDEFSTIHNEDISSAHSKIVEDTVVYHSHTVSEPDDRRVRRIAPRGKSMEELGVSKTSKPEVLSKSSEQLDQLQRKQVVSGKDKRSVSFLAEGTHTEKSLFSSGEHTNDFQAGPERQHLTSSVKHLYSYEDKIQMAPCSDESKIGDDTVMSVRSTEADEITLETGSKEQNTSCQYVPNQDISLSHGITTVPNLWTSIPEINETRSRPSSETTVVEPQKKLTTPCSEREPTPTFPDIQDVESSRISAVNREEDGNEKEEDRLLVIENKVPEGNGPKQKLEWEVLVQEVVSADQSLACTLYPIANRKTGLMLMEQLLSEDTLLMEEHYKKKQEQKLNHSHSTDTLVEDKPLKSPSSLNNDAAPTNQKAWNTETDVTEKKRKLIAHIEEGLTSLQEVRSTLRVEEKDNGKLGDAIETLVRECCLPAELERYRQFIGDLERVISLLLCLSARLARIQNALSTVDDTTDTEEKQSLDNRHRLLCKQRDDAKDLKDNLDRRERVVSAFLSKQLTDTQLQEYRRFVQTKASLLIRLKDLDEKQRLGDEQIEALLTSIPR
ncbi:protein Shroom1 [Triplophysa dalaica]|uniref:protein Shroom1 n=1 Tax=Triplophysa dalaica TaxID=1582913 RepID=UPI0024DFA76D|nr:protein Shroom1 [Triplophysa dalaica]